MEENLMMNGTVVVVKDKTEGDWNFLEHRWSGQE